MNDSCAVSVAGGGWLRLSGCLLGALGRTCAATVREGRRGDEGEGCY